MNEIKVEYFAALREHTGLGAEQVRTAARTAAELFAELDARYGFPEMGRLKVAVNDEFGDWDSNLADGDSVVFIPPVAGG
ncbi:MAG: MoaD/ThiS family protein [Gammaproteobacteria bacterium]|nr:MoaD/ThiS family protein [Gammaproteobacteria bacterium]